MNLDSINSLMQNNLFRQLLLAAGQDLLAGQPFGQNLGAAMQQNIAAQSQKKTTDKFMQQIAAMLAGKIPEGGKIVQSDKGFQLSMPGNFLNDPGDAEAGGTGRASMFPATTPQQVNVPRLQPFSVPLQTGGVSNPFATSQLDDSADLAGLTPENVSQALRDAIGMQTLKQRSVSDVMDMLYKQELIESSRASRTGVKALDPVDSPFPVEHYKYGTLSLREWKELPTNEQSYALYRDMAKDLDDKPPLTKEEWADIPLSAQADFLKDLSENPELRKIYDEIHASEKLPKEPTPMSWGQSANELSQRFGTMDANGYIHIPPENQALHVKAKEKFEELRLEGMTPMGAVNTAEKYARAWLSAEENKYYRLKARAQNESDKKRRQELLKVIDSAFQRNFGFLPR